MLQAGYTWLRATVIRIRVLRHRQRILVLLHRRMAKLRVALIVIVRRATWRRRSRQPNPRTQGTIRATARSASRLPVPAERLGNWMFRSHSHKLHIKHLWRPSLRSAKFFFPLRAPAARLFRIVNRRVTASAWVRIASAVRQLKSYVKFTHPPRLGFQ